MIAAWPGARSVTVHRPGPRDRHGDTSEASAHLVHGCLWHQETSTEHTDARAQVITTVELFAPYGADIAARDVLTLPDSPGRWRVLGDPAAWRSSAGPGGVQVRLEKVQG